MSQLTEPAEVIRTSDNQLLCCKSIDKLISESEAPGQRLRVLDLAGRDDIAVAAINDLYDNAHLAYLLKYDTVMRVFPKEVRVEADAELLTVPAREMRWAGRAPLIAPRSGPAPLGEVPDCSSSCSSSAAFP